MHGDAIEHIRDGCEKMLPFSHVSLLYRADRRYALEMAIHEGDAAPDFEVLDDQGKPFRIKDLKGKEVVLYFYPKADTPGCTKEACEFRDSVSQFKKRGVEVIGVSPDKPEAQAKFKSKYKLTFPLLADEDHKIADAYGVWKQKSMYGKKYMGVERTTFLIGADGRVRKVFEKVKPEGHAAQILAEL
jgi:peroxiredoxin Q/BCP